MNRAIVLLSFVAVTLTSSVQNDVASTKAVDSQIKTCATQMVSELTAYKTSPAANAITCGTIFIDSLSGLRDQIFEFSSEIQKNVYPEVLVVGTICKETSADPVKCVSEAFKENNTVFAKSISIQADIVEKLQGAVKAGVTCANENSKYVNVDAASIFKTFNECLSASGDAQ